MDTAMPLMQRVYHSMRAQMVGRLLERMAAKHPFMTADDCKADPAIALHDLMWQQLEKLQRHAVKWASTHAAGGDNESSTHDPWAADCEAFGESGVMRSR